MAVERTRLLGCFGALPRGLNSWFSSRKDYNSLGKQLRHTDGCCHVMLGFTLVTNQGDIRGHQPTSGVSGSAGWNIK